MSETIVDRATELLEMIEGKWMTQAIGVAAELDVPDLVASGTVRTDAIAAATGCDADAIERLMRALVSLGVCLQRPDRTFELTATGQLLRDGDGASLRSWAIWSARYHWPTWGRLIESVRRGESARVIAGGTDTYSHLDHDAAAAEVFNRGLGGLTSIVGHELARLHDFSQARSVMDIGGGQGQLLAAVLEGHPHLRGILFDRSHAIDTSPAIDRCERMTGDFFEAIPPGADVYLLKSILHNWDDARCRTILAQCRRAMGTDGSLLLVERVLPETPSAAPSERPLARSDLNMLVGFSGRERTLAGFGALLASCGLGVRSSRPLALGFSLIETR